jgi:transcriptional regulator with XRE-family HTH domain
MLDHSLPPDVHPAASGDSHPPVSPEDAITRVGNRIRQARDTMSVKRLADVSGISAGLISEIERGKGNPSFKTLHAIANALGLRIGDLVDDDDDGPKSGLVRRHERKRLDVGQEGPDWELLSPNLRGQLEVLETSLPDGFSNESSPFQHVGEECVVVQRSSVEISVGGVLYLLDEGDAITYDAAIPHWYRNNSGATAVVLGVVTPPSF